jgi:hypothetical protein
VRIELEPEECEALVEEITRRVLERLASDDNGSPWLSGAQAAADYLGWPRERVYKRLSELPHYREGARLMFRRDEPDRYIEENS